MRSVPLRKSDAHGNTNANDSVVDSSKFIDYMHRELKPQEPDRTAPIVIDLFAGCGGLALGFEAVGFSTIGFEMVEDACATYTKNLYGDCYCIRLTKETDLNIEPHIIIGGPPCQPFSVGGLQMGSDDPRDGFPVFLGCVERYRPKVAVFENVRGMLYKGRRYLADITQFLETLGYIVEARILHAIHFGVPQKRERLFVVAHRGCWSFPRGTFFQPVTAGEALAELAYRIPENAKFLTADMDKYVANYELASKCIRPRDLHLNQPSRTLTCRNLNGATGDMMRIRLKDGRRRRLSVRESARLQGFPDWFQFCGTEGSQFNQIGNAVPPLLAKALATEVWKSYHGPELSQGAIDRTNSKHQRVAQAEMF